MGNLSFINNAMFILTDVKICESLQSEKLSNIYMTTII